jgi:hypothetical protein
MRRLPSLLSKKLRSEKGKTGPHSRRLQVEALEHRQCPAAVVLAGFVPGTAVLNVVEVSSDNSPIGPGATLTFTGDTPPGGGVTSALTITGGPGTTVNGSNSATFSVAFPGAITQINVAFLNDNDSLTVGTSTGIVNLPGATLNVLEGSGQDTFTMGTAGSPTASEVNNTLNAVNWVAVNLQGTGTESFSILDATVASFTVVQNDGPANSIQLWGVTANGQVTLVQGNGNGDTISVDQLNSTNPNTTIPSTLGALITSQGNGANDSAALNRTQARVFLTGVQGNGNGDSYFLGTGDTVGSNVAPGGSPAIYNGTAIFVQGAGSGDYFGVNNIQAGVMDVLQQD